MLDAAEKRFAAFVFMSGPQKMGRPRKRRRGPMRELMRASSAPPRRCSNTACMTKNSYRGGRQKLSGHGLGTEKSRILRCGPCAECQGPHRPRRLPAQNIETPSRTIVQKAIPAMIGPMRNRMLCAMALLTRPCVRHGSAGRRPRRMPAGQQHRQPPGARRSRIFPCTSR